MLKHSPNTKFKPESSRQSQIRPLLTLDLQIYGKFTKVEGLLLLYTGIPQNAISYAY